MNTNNTLAIRPTRKGGILLVAYEFKRCVLPVVLTGLDLRNGQSIGPIAVARSYARAASGSSLR